MSTLSSPSRSRTAVGNPALFDVLLDLHAAEAVQEGLFDKKDEARRVMLMRTVDRLNLRFGRDTISFAAAGRRQRPWGLRRELLSPCYTTDLG